MRLQFRGGQFTTFGVCGAAIVMLASGCSGGASPVPRAAVTSAQRAAITRLGTRQFLSVYGEQRSPRAACPVDVLGAAHIAGHLRVYTVVNCETASAKCAGFTSLTYGLVANMRGSKILGTQEDTAPYSAGVISQARIYPPSIRSIAVSDINADGPVWLWNLAAKEAGCPHGIR